MAIDPEARMERGLKLTNWVFSLAVAATAAVVIVLVLRRPDTGERMEVQKLLFAAWTLGPPIGLVAQHLLWPPAVEGIERFRTQQALIKAVWGGIVGFLAASFFGHWG
jgi:hypothetical protein